MILLSKKGQIETQEILSIFVVITILIVFIPLFTFIINSFSSGNIENTLDALVNSLIPLFILLFFVEFLRRLFE